MTSSSRASVVRSRALTPHSATTQPSHLVTLALSRRTHVRSSLATWWASTHASRTLTRRTFQRSTVRGKPWCKLAHQLPPGLSLDANTGLIYGTLTGITSLPSVIQYIDGSGGVHGTITITWITLLNQFQLTDNIVDSQQVGNVYNGASALTPPSGITIQSVSIAGSQLPNGLNVAVNNGTNAIDITGTPTEAGYFDIWFSVISTNGKTATIYHRISTVIPAPVLSILGWADVIAGPALGHNTRLPATERNHRRKLRQPSYRVIRLPSFSVTQSRQSR